MPNVVDMHCDTVSALWQSRRAGTPLSLRENRLDVDLVKMRRGGYLVQNFAMFVFLGREDDPLVNVLELIDEYYRQLAANSDLIAPVYTCADIEKNAREGKLSALMTVEEGGVCKGSVEVLRCLYRLGVRMMTLTWNFENELGYPGTDVTTGDFAPSWRDGLKPAGIEFVREMNRLGMIVDVSHLSDGGFRDVASHCKGPFVASHSNARAVCPHSRNLADEQIRALADKGGVMGINFCDAFLSPDGPGTVDGMLRHIRHIRNVGGTGVIGLGSDFDGIDVKPEIRDASLMPLLAQGMERGGFTAGEIEAVFSGNVLRVYREIL